MKTFTKTAKLLKVYRTKGLSLGGAYKRLGAFKSKHSLI